MRWRQRNLVTNTQLRICNNVTVKQGAVTVRQYRDYHRGDEVTKQIYFSQILMGV